MNQHLQTILTFIQQFIHLTDEEKTALTAAAKDANEELDNKPIAIEAQNRNWRCWHQALPTSAMPKLPLRMMHSRVILMN